MFCPRCGQQPASQAIRFCANCGLRLEGVSYLLTNDGLLPSQTIAPPPEPTLKQREMRRGVKFLFSSFVAFPLFFALCFIPDNPVPLLAPATLFIMGICWMMYARFFCDNTTAPQKPTPIHASLQPAYAPPTQQHAAFPPIKTTEIEPPHSVIEHTTRQLGREKQPQ